MLLAIYNDSVCANLDNADLGRELHDIIIQDNVTQTVELQTALINMYAKTGDITMARNLFANMKGDAQPNYVSYTVMIVGYLHQDRPEEAIKLFEVMRKTNVKPNDITYALVLNACSELTAVNLGQAYYNDAVNSGIAITPFLQCALMTLYGKCGKLQQAISIFEEMVKSHDTLSTEVWNSIISV